MASLVCIILWAEQFIKLIIFLNKHKMEKTCCTLFNVFAMKHREIPIEASPFFIFYSFVNKAKGLPLRTYTLNQMGCIYTNPT